MVLGYSWAGEARPGPSRFLCTCLFIPDLTPTLFFLSHDFLDEFFGTVYLGGPIGRFTAGKLHGNLSQIFSVPIVAGRGCSQLDRRQTTGRMSPVPRHGPCRPRACPTTPKWNIFSASTMTNPGLYARTCHVLII